MKIRWASSPIAGSFHNDPLGVQRGQVVDIDDVWALGYIAGGQATPVGEKAKEVVASVPEVEKDAFVHPEPKPEKPEPVIGGGGDMGGEAPGEPHFPDKEWVEELPDAVRPEPEVEVFEAEPVKLVEPESKPKPRPRRTPRSSK